MSPAYSSHIDFWAVHITESTLFAIGVLILVSIARFQEGQTRFRFYQLALSKFLVPVGPFLSHVFDSDTLRSIPIANLTFAPLASPASALSQESPSDWSFLLLAIWASGFTILAVARAIGFYRTLSFGSSNRLHKEEVQELPIFIDNRVSSIGLVGYFRPRIIVNAAFLDALSHKELMAAVSHEIAHARRKDNLWRLLHEVIVALFWLHPLVWVLRNKLCSESEHACDEFALSQGEEPHDYAKCLVKAASLNTHYTSRWVTSFSAAALKKRIRKITTFENKKESKMKTLFTHLAVWSLLGLVALTSSSLTASESRTASTEDKIYSMSDLDVHPRAIEMVTPEYPKALHDQKITGRVVVEWILNEEGKVLSPKVIKSTHDEFKQPSLDAVTATQWAPGEIAGKAVNVRIRMPIKFQP
ncbi:M56 family metallopeptidase [Pelagicoccus mobilis]|uniref:M56 family metallopeptidase n=1 Tax=Pelagicoccus mobilis TaxID=415221 RepID=A0A934VTQ2_9BACT|nr:M56 family metallopeptidase [Pelagicoccus mobilis]MBK1880310.1 M56 family metallopeptidase [Pelagicoccus mobilis]